MSWFNSGGPGFIRSWGSWLTFWRERQVRGTSEKDAQSAGHLVAPRSDDAEDRESNMANEVENKADFS